LLRCARNDADICRVPTPERGAWELPRDVTAKPGASRRRHNPLHHAGACPGHPRRHARRQRQRMKILPSVQDLERSARSPAWISGTSPGMTDRATLRPPDLAVTDAPPSERPRVAAFGAQGFEKADSSFRIGGEIVARRGAGLAVTARV
jgi:hypothetical protein